MSSDLVLWIFLAAFVLLIFIAYIVVQQIIRSKEKAREKIKEEYCASFISTGITEANAKQLANLQLHLKGEGLEEAPFRTYIEMKYLIEKINNVCESLRLHPDEKAKDYLQDQALLLLDQKKIPTDEGVPEVSGYTSYWMKVMFELNLYLSVSYYPSFNMERFTERLLFLAVIADLDKCFATVPEYEYCINSIGERCGTENCKERWSKWLMEDGIFKGLLERDLKKFSDAGYLSEEFAEYFKKYHIRPVAFLLKNLADGLALAQMKSRFFANGDTQVSNEAYVEMARAYTKFNETLLES